MIEHTFPLICAERIQQLQNGLVFRSRTLNDLLQAGVIALQPLGPVVEDANGRVYNVEQLTNVVYFTRTDIAPRTGEGNDDWLRRVRSQFQIMADNALTVVEEEILNLAINNRRVVLSNTNRCAVGPVGYMGNDTFSCSIITACARIPLGS